MRFIKLSNLFRRKKKIIIDDNDRCEYTEFFLIEPEEISPIEEQYEFIDEDPESFHR